MKCLFEKKDSSRLCNYLKHRFAEAPVTVKQSQQKASNDTNADRGGDKLSRSHRNPRDVVKRITSKRKNLSTKQSGKKVKVDQEDVQLKQDVKNLLAKLKSTDGEEDFESDEEMASGSPDRESKDRSLQLASKAKQTLAMSMFRSFNEFLYTHSSYESRKEFSQNKFQLYHEAYEKLVENWPVKPVDYLLEVLKVL